MRVQDTCFLLLVSAIEAHLQLVRDTSGFKTDIQHKIRDHGKYRK